MQAKLHRKAATLCFALTALTVVAKADPILYVVNEDHRFGSIDLVNGSFQTIGPVLPEHTIGLAAGPGGSLLTLGFSSNLYSINPSSGLSTLVGPTGLASCTNAADVCGASAGNTIGSLGSHVYATDFANNLYSINQESGAATLIGHTGIPAVPVTPETSNPDGTVNLFEENLFGSNGRLYATFDAFAIDFVSFATTPVIPFGLYEIDPSTGSTTLLGSDPTELLNAAAGTGDGAYGYNAGTGELLRLDLATGKTTHLLDVDPAAGVVSGVFSPVPEPSSLALVGTGLCAVATCWRRRSLKP